MRRGLVLGAGGVLGAAWTTGALSAVQEHLDWDPREAEVIVGTSAGSVLAATLGCGLGVAEMLGHQRGEDGTGIEYDHETASGGARPPLPRPLPGSPRGMVRSAMHPMRTTPMMALSTALPHGRASLEPVGDLVDAVVPHGSWAPHPATWVVAMDYDDGRRTVFGRPDSPPAALRDAVMASCAIPGWYSPVRVGRRRYVDGGACSPTSLDLVARLRLDEVVVLSPMTSLDYDRPDTVPGRLERRFRRLSTRRVITEVKKVAAGGTRVTLLGPTARDLDAIGANLMDPRRRRRVLETSLATSRDTLRSEALRHTG